MNTRHVGIMCCVGLQSIMHWLRSQAPVTKSSCKSASHPTVRFSKYSDGGRRLPAGRSSLNKQSSSLK